MKKTFGTELITFLSLQSPIWFDAIKFHENMYQAENSEPAI